jgi:hypothetical protein
VLITCLHYIVEHQSNHFVGEMPGNMLGAMVPETDSPPRVDDIDTHGKILHQVTE